MAEPVRVELQPTSPDVLAGRTEARNIENLPSIEQIRTTYRRHFVTMMEAFFFADTPTNVAFEKSVLDNLSKSRVVGARDPMPPGPAKEALIDALKNEIFITRTVFDVVLGDDGIASVPDLGNAAGKGTKIAAYLRPLIDTFIPRAGVNLTAAHGMEQLDYIFRESVGDNRFPFKIDPATGAFTNRLNDKYATIDQTRPENGLVPILGRGRNRFDFMYGADFNNGGPTDWRVDRDYTYWMGVLLYFAGQEQRKWGFKTDYLPLSILIGKQRTDTVIAGSEQGSVAEKHFWIWQSWRLPLLSRHALGYFTMEQVKGTPADPDSRPLIDPTDPAGIRYGLVRAIDPALRPEYLVDAEALRVKVRAAGWMPDINRHYGKFGNDIMSADPKLLEYFTTNPTGVLAEFVKKAGETIKETPKQIRDGFWAALTEIAISRYQPLSATDAEFLSMDRGRSPYWHATRKDAQITDPDVTIRDLNLESLLSFNGQPKEMVRLVKRHIKDRTLTKDVWELSKSSAGAAVKSLLEGLGKSLKL